MCKELKDENIRSNFVFTDAKISTIVQSAIEFVLCIQKRKIYDLFVEFSRKTKF